MSWCVQMPAVSAPDHTLLPCGLFRANIWVCKAILLHVPSQPGTILYQNVS